MKRFFGRPTVKSVRRFLRKLLVIVFALTLSTSFWYSYQNRRELNFIQWEKNRPVDDWIEVITLYVPDFRISYFRNNPYAELVTFERVIKRDMQGEWEVQVMDLSNGSQSICRGSGTSKYLIEEPRVQKFPLREFIANECLQLVPGKYQLRIRWDFRDLTTNIYKSLTMNSNEFVVSE